MITRRSFFGALAALVVAPKVVPEIKWIHGTNNPDYRAVRLWSIIGRNQFYGGWRGGGKTATMYDEMTKVTFNIYEKSLKMQFEQGNFYETLKKR